MEFLFAVAMGKPVWMWAVFISIVILLLIFDLGVLHRNLSITEQVRQLKIALEAKVKAGVAVGFGADFESRVETLAQLKPHVMCIDSAHGHTKNIMETTKFIKQRYPAICLISGNVATYEGAKALFEAGADVVKVGMGSGSICTTRIVSGVGVPQLSAIFECAKAAREYKRPIIADGGIRNSGDIVKALAAGASAVMLGSLLAGTDESVGELVEYNKVSYKSTGGWVRSNRWSREALRAMVNIIPLVRNKNWCQKGWRV